MRSIFKLLALLFLAIAAFGQQINLDTQVKGSRMPSWGVDSGAANAYVLTTIWPFGPGLKTGSFVQFSAANSNTGASTVNVNGVGVKNIKKMSGGSLVALTNGDITSGQIHLLFYDGTQFQCVTCISGGGGGGVTSLTGDGSLITNSASTGAVTLTLGNASGHKWWGNNTGSSAAPGYETIGNPDLPGSGSTTVNGTACTLGSTCTITANGGSWNYFFCANNGTGTTLNKIARSNGTACQTVSTADAVTVNIVGICVGGCGTSGFAMIATEGSTNVPCVFDGAGGSGSTEGDITVWSTTANGDCHDSGTTPISIGSAYSIGLQESTNSGAGTYPVDVYATAQSDAGSAFNGMFMVKAPRSPFWYSTGLVTTGTGGQGFTDVHLVEGKHFCWDSSGGGTGGLGCISAKTGTNGGLVFEPDFSGNGFSMNIKGGLFGQINGAGSVSGNWGFALNLGMVNTITASGGNVTLTNPTNVNAGQIFIIEGCEDSTGGWTWSWGANFKNPPSFSTVASACSWALFSSSSSTAIYTLASTIATGGSGGGSTPPPTYQCSNDSTGTVINKLARLNGTQCRETVTGDAATIQVVGVCTAGCGTSGFSTIQYAGQVSLVMDGSVTAGDTFTWSTTTNGDGHDTGGRTMSQYGSAYEIGTVVSTNTGAGTYLVDLHPTSGNDPQGNNRDFIPLMSFSGSMYQPSGLYQDAYNSTTANLHLTTGMKFWLDDSSGNANGNFQDQPTSNTTNPGINENCDPNAVGVSCVIWGGLQTKYGDNGTVSGTQTPACYANTIFKYTISGNSTIANPTNCHPGSRLVLLLCENGTGGFSWSWGNAFINPPAPATAAGACSPYSFFWVDSTHIYAINGANASSSSGGSISTVTLCKSTGLTDTLTAAGNFATTCTVPAGTSGFGTKFDIYAVGTEHIVSGDNHQYGFSNGEAGGTITQIGHSAAVGDYVWSLHFSYTILYDASSANLTAGEAMTNGQCLVYQQNGGGGHFFSCESVLLAQTPSSSHTLTISAGSFQVGSNSVLTEFWVTQTQ